MKIGILATGITPDNLIGEFGSYADMFVQLFEAAGCRFQFETFDVRDDHFPESATLCDGWLITGSKLSAYDGLPWMQRLKRLIVEIYESDRPLIGICFGHQIVAEAFGGRVEKYPGGWGVGLHRYQLVGKNALFAPESSAFTINAMHQDQVIIKPENAETIASSEFCPYAGLRYGDRILTLQAHPEFGVPYEYALVQERKGSVIPQDRAEQGLKTLRAPDAATDSLAVARWMAAFLKQRGEVGSAACES